MFQLALAVCGVGEVAALRERWTEPKRDRLQGDAKSLTGRPVSAAWMEWLSRGGVAVLMALMSVALFNDLARLLG